MVIYPEGYPEVIVLYSSIYRRWKIADFGATSEGTSKRLSPTSSRRGTVVYIAPEVLKEGGYNKKSDIWAFGCIAYEFFTMEKAFRNDWEVMQYRGSEKGFPKRVIIGKWPKGPAPLLVRDLCKCCVDDALRFLWKDRPSAVGMLGILNTLR